MPALLWLEKVVALVPGTILAYRLAYPQLEGLVCSRVLTGAHG